MKKQTLLVFIIAFNGMFCHSQNQPELYFEWINPLPQANILIDMQILDNNTAFAVGRGGTIMKTEDHGTSWQHILTPHTQNFTSLFFLNDQKGYICGANGLILKTIDGGLSWAEQNSGTTETLMAIAFQQDEGIATGYNGTILYTENDGEIWQNKSMDMYNNLIDLDFSPSGTLYCLDSYGMLLKTDDYFETHSHIDLADSPYAYEALDVIKDSTLQVANSKNIMLSNDDGASWVNHNINNMFSFTDLQSVGNTTFATEKGGMVLYSHNNWTNIQSAMNCNNELWGMAIKDSTAYSFGPKGLYYSSDRGENFTSISSGFHKTINDIEFINDSSGFFVAENSIYACTSYCDSLYPIFEADNLTEFAFVSFLNDSTGFAGGTCGLYKTDNGGTSWNQLIAEGDFRDIDFIDNNTGILLDKFTAYKTINGGLAWSEIQYDFTSALAAVDMVNNSIFYIGGTCHLFKSTDAADNWQDMNICCIPINDMSFTDSKTGVIVGEGGLVIFSKNGFDTYEPINAGQDALHAVSHLNDSTAIIAGSGRVHFFHHENQSKETIRTPNISTYAMSLNADTSMILAGRSGTLVRTIDSPNTSRIEEITKGKSISIYPNPCRNAIQVELPGSSEKIWHLYIRDIQNRISMEIPAYRSGEKIFTSSIPAGTYIIYTSNKGTPYTGKFIKIM
jgi:photosystem II stability/assembly factor-like uncharacterized protein